MDRCVKRLADLGAVVQKVQPSHQALACSRNTPLNTDHKSLATSHYLQHPCFTPYELPRHMGRGLDSRANGSFPQGAGRLSEKSTARHPPPHQPSPAGSASATPPQGGSDLGARASRPHPVPLAAAELQCDAAGSHPVGGNGIGWAEGEPWRRCRSIQVEEMAKAVPGLVRAGRPRSQEAIKLQVGSNGLTNGTPALPGSSHPMTSSHHGHQIAEAFWCRLWLKEVHVSSCLFVFLRVHSWFIFMNDRPSFLE